MNANELKGHVAMLGAETMWGLMAPVGKFVLSGAVVTPLILTGHCVQSRFLSLWLGLNHAHQRLDRNDQLAYPDDDYRRHLFT